MIRKEKIKRIIIVVVVVLFVLLFFKKSEIENLENEYKEIDQSIIEFKNDIIYLEERKKEIKGIILDRFNISIEGEEKEENVSIEGEEKLKIYITAN